MACGNTSQLINVKSFRKTPCVPFANQVQYTAPLTLHAGRPMVTVCLLLRRLHFFWAAGCCCNRLLAFLSFPWPADKYPHCTVRRPSGIPRRSTRIMSPRGSSWWPITRSPRVFVWRLCRKRQMIAINSRTERIHKFNQAHVSQVAGPDSLPSSRNLLTTISGVSDF